MTTDFSRRWLLVVTTLVGSYAASLVFVGGVAGQLFDVLGFGMSDGAVPDGQPRDYVLFVYAVLGAVLFGWMVLIAGIAAGPLRAGESWALPVLATSLIAWFILDTGMSLVVGFWQHAAFNLLFLFGLGVPLVLQRKAVKTI